MKKRLFSGVFRTIHPYFPDYSGKYIVIYFREEFWIKQKYSASLSICFPKKKKREKTPLFSIIKELITADNFYKYSASNCNTHMGNSVFRDNMFIVQLVLIYQTLFN